MARIAGINIPQNKVVSVALTYIHGIGLYSSKKICKKLDIPSTKRVNELSEEQVLKIREFIPLMLLIIALENILRVGIGFYKPLIISADPPGALSPLIGLVTLIFFFISIRENR